MFRRKRSENAYEGLRRMALDAASVLPAPPASHPDVGGVVVDIPGGGSYATVVALTDGTTSMYTSTGGGVIGGGEHASVADATARLLAVVQAHLSAFGDNDDELPPDGIVRFHVIGSAGRRTCDVTEAAFWGEAADDAFMPVIAATQEVVSALRDASPDDR